MLLLSSGFGSVGTLIHIVPCYRYARNFCHFSIWIFCIKILVCMEFLMMPQYSSAWCYWNNGIEHFTLMIIWIEIIVFFVIQCCHKFRCTQCGTTSSRNTSTVQYHLWSCHRCTGHHELYKICRYVEFCSDWDGWDMWRGWVRKGW